MWLSVLQGSEKNISVKKQIYFFLKILIVENNQKYSQLLGVKHHQIFASMLVSRDWDTYIFFFFVVFI